MFLVETTSEAMSRADWQCVLTTTWGANGADAVPGHGLRAAHVGAWIEVDRQLTAATDRLGADLGDADDRGDGLFERLCDLDIHVGYGQPRHPGDDGDARKGDFRVDA